MPATSGVGMTGAEQASAAGCCARGAASHGRATAGRGSVEQRLEAAFAGSGNAVEELGLQHGDDGGLRRASAARGPLRTSGTARRRAWDPTAAAAWEEAGRRSAAGRSGESVASSRETEGQPLERKHFSSF